MESSSKKFLLPFLFSLVLIVGMFLGFKMSKSFPSKNNTSSYTQLDALVNLIQQEYVDSLNYETLYNNGVEGILKTLDPHTVFIPKKNVKDVNQQLEGEFYGIGIEFFTYNDTVFVASVLPSSPAQQSTIEIGDRVLKIDDSLLIGKSYSDEEVIQLIKGQKNKPVALTVLHLNNTTEKITIKRNAIPVKSVPASFMVNDTTGYVYIKVFSENTYDEFKLALQKLIKQNCKNLIIDVRDNPGGYMDAVAKIADELIADKHTLIITKGKNQVDSIQSEVKGLFEKEKVSVLINENSASASEILAGLMQDLDRGNVIGRRSYGKGLVQEQFDLPDGSAIRITVARYYLPSGRCIQKDYSHGKEEYGNEIEERFAKGELLQQDSLQYQKKPIYYTTNKRKVYGFDAITPDYFVALDTTFSQKIIRFYTQHIAERFAQRYFYFHKKDFQQYKNVQQFHIQFMLKDIAEYELMQWMLKASIPLSLLNNKMIFNTIHAAMKQEFSKIIFGNEGKCYEQCLEDEFVKRAL